MTTTDEALDLLLRMQQCWATMSAFRARRDRCFRYTYGDQWSDKVEVDGRWMRESDQLRLMGQTPLQNNLIHRLVRTVVGVWRNQSEMPRLMLWQHDDETPAPTVGTNASTATTTEGEPTATPECPACKKMNALLRRSWRRNSMTEINARTMEELLVGGMVVHRKAWGLRRGMADSWTDYVNPACFVFDGVARDFRGWDTTMVGEIHDCTLGQVTASFARTEADCRVIEQVYRLASDSRSFGSHYDRFFSPSGRNNFLMPADRSMCRVFEIWTRENTPRLRCHDWRDGTLWKCDASDGTTLVDAENNRRLAEARGQGLEPTEVPLITAMPFVDTTWHYRYITPTGLVLREGESPFAHRGHPYVFRCYPFINGEIHSFVSDIIDQQRYINRIMSQIDMIARASSKGVLAIPRSAIGEGVTRESIMRAWSRPTGSFVYNDNGGRTGAPEQISTSMSSDTLQTMLTTQQKILEDASGIHEALQGKGVATTTSGVLYNQQTQNSIIAILDILGTFEAFVNDCAWLDSANIRQYCPEAADIAGKEFEISDF